MALRLQNRRWYPPKASRPDQPRPLSWLIKGTIESLQTICDSRIAEGERSGVRRYGEPIRGGEVRIRLNYVS